MPKKKQPKNAFYFFMKDYKEEQEQDGFRFTGGMKEVADKAGPAWSTLSKAERQHYENLAAEHKLKEKGDLRNKFTTMGISYHQLQKEEEEKREMEQKMMNEIIGTVQRLDRDTTMRTNVFLFVHFNHYCRVEDGSYLVCEVAIAKFNLQRGVEDIYHRIIKHEKIPTGFQFEAKSTSEESHQIPLPPELNEGEPYKGRLFYEIKSFVEETKKGAKLPPLYTYDRHVEVAQNALTVLAEHHYPQDPDLFRVYPLSLLFFYLRNAVCPPGRLDLGFPSETIALRELEKDVYNFAPGIACKMHEKQDSCVYCSKSIVTRWAFLICDHCCKDLQIPIIRGKHVPINAAILEEPDKDEEGNDPFQSQNKEDKRCAPSTYAGFAKAVAKSRPKADIPVNSLNVIDLRKSSPGDIHAHHYSINAASIPTSPSALPGTSCWGQPAAPLRHPSLLPTSVKEACFGEDDFPSLGSRSSVNAPAAVAGRGRGRARILLEENVPGGLERRVDDGSNNDNDNDDGASFHIVVGRGRIRDNRSGSRLAANLQGLNLH